MRARILIRLTFLENNIFLTAPSLGLNNLELNDNFMLWQVFSTLQAHLDINLDELVNTYQK